jgi:hypothetical protein
MFENTKSSVRDYIYVLHRKLKCRINLLDTTGLLLS